MRLAICLALLCPVLLMAQMGNLATTDDGGHLYFSSHLRMTGSGQEDRPKIFRIIPEGLVLFAEEERSLVEPSVTGDGRIVAYTAVLDCRGGSCVEGRIAGAEDFAPCGPGRIRLSHYGRFAVSFDLSGDACLADRATGDVRPFPYRGPSPLRQNITASGAVLLPHGDRLELLDPAGSRFYAIGAVDAVIDDDGSRIVFETAAPHRLSLLDPLTGSTVVLAQSNTVLPFRPVLSRDGTLVLYLLNGEVVIARTDGTGRRVTTGAAERLVEATLSGSGRIAFAVTTSGRLLRIDTTDGQSGELLPPVPFVSRLTGGAAPGSLVRLFGGGLGELEIRLNGEPVPVLARLPGELHVQIPWEAEPGEAAITYDGAGPFTAPPFRFRVATTDPRFEERGGLPVLVRGDFSGLISPLDGIEGGEVFHLYGTGFGPVSSPPPTGEPAALDRLHSLLAPATCFLHGTSRRWAADVWFAGLAPGLTGLYQLTVRMPYGVDQPAILRCGFGEAYANAPVPVRAP